MSNDRLKFRSWVKDVDLSDKDGNEYKKSFMINNVTVFGGCAVGTYVEDLIEQLEEQGFTDDEIEQVRDYYSENDDWINFDADFIEQCTGLKDKNGKLIYEGDVLYCLLNRPRKVIVEYNMNAFCFNENGTYSEDIIFSDKCCEVIGNIHENPELLEGVK